MEDKKYVEQVRADYLPHERTKLDELKSLDKKVKTFPSVLAYTLGVIAALVLGVGMCLAMRVIGASLMSPVALTAVGVVIGCVGIALCVANYFIYKAVLKSRKNTYGSRITALAEELLGE